MGENSKEEMFNIMQILSSHKLWLKSGGKDGKRAVFPSDTPLVFPNWNLDGANLAQAILPSANFRKSSLDNSDFSGATLDNTTFYCAKLRRANFNHADLENVNMLGANLTEANLENAILKGANLQGANLYKANLKGADLTHARLEGANFEDADLTGAILKFADCTNTRFLRTNLEHSDISKANLCGANLSGATGIPSAGEWLKRHFKFTPEGVIVYKAIGETYHFPPPHWKIAPGEFLTEVVNPVPTYSCGCGVNFGTLEYIKSEFRDEIIHGVTIIWECLIPYEDLADVVVPYNTWNDVGKARCRRLKLIRQLFFDEI